MSEIKKNSFEKMANMMLEDVKKYGVIDKDGQMFIDSGLQKQRIGNIKEVKEKIDNYYTKTNLAEKLLDLQPLYYDEGKLWWIWDKDEYKWVQIDETGILNYVRQLSVANTVNSKERSEILESLKQEARLRKPKEIKKEWIQFKNTIVDIETGENFEATPEYFVTNPIPFKMSEEDNTPNMDRIFEQWVGKDYVQTLYEIISYCLLPDYPIHRLFCLIGEGMNGKSKFLDLIKTFVGISNCCSTELDLLLTSKFEVTRLHKKLVCIMGETNFNEINKTSIIKKLTGGDLIGFEYKNKNPFEDVNYAKIVIATNNLPTTDDKTIGFYRRWMIIDFPNGFSEAKDILSEIPEEEYECLATKCIFTLNKLLKERKFHNEGDIKQRKDMYEEKSNPFDKFWKENIKEDLENDLTKAQLKRNLEQWCKENKFRMLSDQSINKRMKEKGVESGVTYIDWYQEGSLVQKKQAKAWKGVKFK